MKSGIVLLFFVLFAVNNANIALGAEITVKAPNGGGTFVVGAFTNITWTTTGTVDKVNIDLTINNGANWNPIDTSVINTGSYAWTVSDVSSDICRIKVSDVTPDGPSDMSDSVFSIKQIRYLIITAPNGGESLKVGAKQNITWNTYGKIDNVRIEISNDDGKTWIIFTAKTENKGSYNIYVPDIVTNLCMIKVSSSSDTGISDMSDSPFSIYNPNVAISNQPGIPKITSLINIGPNPVRINLYINFSLTQRGNVLIEIYSLRGQLVKRLANEMKEAGLYKLLWNGTDSSGHKAPTGSYLMKLSIGDKIYKKMLAVIK